MKRLLFFICTLLCANVLLAFTIDSLSYSVTSTNPRKVIVSNANLSITTANIPATVTYQGTTYDVTSIGAQAFRDCDNLTSVTIPNSVTYIGYEAFRNCISLTSVTIPNSVTSTGGGVFERCLSLTSVTIPNSVTSIGFNAFRDCSSLTSVTIPNSVTSIGAGAFERCLSLTSVTIPNSVTSIYYEAFSCCSSLTSVTIPNSVTSIGQGAFRVCSSLTSVTIPNSVTSIGYEAFAYCSSLTSVTIPNSITSIGEDAFAYCSSLTSVTIPNSVTSIGEHAFYECSSLTSVTSLATNPPFLLDYAFLYIGSPSTLYVPNGCRQAYVNSAWAQWFDCIVELCSDNSIPELNVEVNNEEWGHVEVHEWCGNATLRAVADNDCYQFVSWNDGNTENPRVVSLSSDTSFVANFIISNINTEIAATICQGQTYTENNFNVSEAGVYTQTLTSVNGCDSIVTLTVSVNPTFDTTINATINSGETYSEFGFNESESGTYVQNLQTEAGCDSTITLNLTVNSSLYDVAEFAELSVYPNPTSGKVTFNQAIEKIEVIDNIGKVVMRFFDTNEINIDALPAGAYYLRMTIEDKTIMRKVIKE